MSETQSKLTEQIRDTAKWLIAAIGAVAAIALAGVHLSDLASANGVRLVVSLSAVAIAMVAVLWAIWRTAIVLIPSSLTLEEVVEGKFTLTRQQLSNDPLLRGIELDNLSGQRERTMALVDGQEHEFDEAYRTNSRLKPVIQDRLMRARENAAAVDRTIEVVETLGRYYETRRLFRAALTWLAVAVVVIFAGGVVLLLVVPRVLPPTAAAVCPHTLALTAYSDVAAATDQSRCIVIVQLTPKGRQAYEKEASALTGSSCQIDPEINPLGILTSTAPVSVELIEVNMRSRGPCITGQVFVLQDGFGNYSPWQGASAA